ncbi:transposable element Tcb2 transposase [Trichonephila clavipes]|nr:transposable element Tcb2 transposase [Trichonephila clavipes]
MSFTRRPGSGCPLQTSRREDRHIVINARVQPTASSAAIHAQGAVQKETGLLRNGTRFQESRFDLSCDDNRVRVWRPRGERLNPAFALQRHTISTDGVIVWDVIAYNTRSPLLLIRGTMTAQRFVHNVLQPHVLPLIQRFPGAIFQQNNSQPHTARVSKDCLRIVTTFPWPSQPPICLQTIISGFILNGELDILQV